MVAALVLSGGSGSRLGGKVPKQYIEVGGKPILSYCIEALSRSTSIDAIWIVAAVEWQGKIKEWLLAADAGQKFMGFATPGENRQLSIYNGMAALKKMATDEDYVLIHDAARPCLSDGDIAACLEAVPGHDGVVPVLPMKDTVYLSADGNSITSLLERGQVFAGQAPELFVLGKYWKANEALLASPVGGGMDGEGSLGAAILKINGSTEPAFLAGMDIAMAMGNERNFKITTQGDLERFQALVRAF